MGDGHLNKCKECTKKDARDSLDINLKNPLWIISERTRHREKSRMYRSLGLAPKSGKPGFFPKYKRDASHKVNNAVRDGKLKKEPCLACGDTKVQGHHEDYSRPLYVKWLCVKHHMERHVYLNNCKVLEVDPYPVEMQFAIQELQRA